MQWGELVGQAVGGGLMQLGLIVLLAGIAIGFAIAWVSRRR